MTQTSTPIYHQVCEDLKVYPLAMKQRSHPQFMRDHGQREWLTGAFTRMNAWVAPLPARPSRRLRAVKQR